MATPLQIRLGRWIFRWRSLTPVPIIAVILGLAVRPLLRGQAADVPAATALAGLVACILGQALRAYVRAVVPLDTSSQGLSLGAGSLNTGGAYRFTRNPLYFGNFLLCVGLLCQIDQLAAYALGLGFFFVEYHFIIRAEEAFLEERFGDPYRRFLAEVPRFWPRPWPVQGAPTLPFDAARALRTEHNVAAGWIAGLLAVAALHAGAAGLPAALPWFAALVALGLVYLAVKGWKRGWWLQPAGGRDA